MELFGGSFMQGELVTGYVILNILSISGVRANHSRLVALASYT
jgi:hypothetical protein